MGERRSTHEVNLNYKGLVWASKERETHGKQMNRLDDIKIYLKEIWCKGGD
jgi:hypothetical protein